MARAVLQKTLNEQVNQEALAAYARKLYARQDGIGSWNWPDAPTEAQQAAIAALSRAQSALELAASLVSFAERLADDVFYKRVYGPRKPTA